MKTITIPDGKINAYADAIATVLNFLHENEQYGDDWGEEIQNLDEMLGLLMED